MISSLSASEGAVGYKSRDGGDVVDSGDFPKYLQGTDHAVKRQTSGEESGEQLVNLNKLELRNEHEEKFPTLTSWNSSQGEMPESCSSMYITDWSEHKVHCQHFSV